MTLEQMVNWIADRDHLHDGPKIIAALKAGRGMRESLSIARYATLHGDRTYLQADIINNKLTVMSIDAWDAATKGDEP